MELVKLRYLSGLQPSRPSTCRNDKQFSRPTAAAGAAGAAGVISIAQPEHAGKALCADGHARL